MSKELEGQLTIFDIRGTHDFRRPCDYRFQRYIGQRVKFTGKYVRSRGRIGKVVRIEPYYTELVMEDNHETLIGTPHDLDEVRDEQIDN